MSLVWLAFAAVSVVAACNEGSCSSSHPALGTSLMQSKRFVGPHRGESFQGESASSTLVKGSDSSRFSRLVNRPGFLQQGFCRSHPCSLSHLDVGPVKNNLGKTADLDEAGYQKVAHLKDDNEMRNFILRVIEQYDCRVKDEGGLMGIVPWFSGTVAEQNFLKLEDALLFAILADGGPWLEYKNSANITGKNAPLDLQGYVEVACTRKDEDMKEFARRLCSDLKIKIVDENGFQGVISYYSGTSTFQSFESLKSELESAASAPGTWAELEK